VGYNRDVAIFALFDHNFVELGISQFDKLVKSPKFRHACEGRHPELFENTGFPPSRE
jgi:hypothetical protein